jgi:signal transduction histidine kinase
LLGKHLRGLGTDLQTLNVELKVEVPDELLVLVDPERMARVLRNLAWNAAEAMYGRAHAVVTIGSRQVPAGVELCVADNGPAFAPEALNKLFQPFSTHSGPGGAGFGLAIARQLVEAHGGRIAVASSEQGTRFTIVLPAETADDEATVAAEIDSFRPDVPPAP